MTIWDTGRGAAGETELLEVRRWIRRITASPLKGTETGEVLEYVLGSSGKMIRPRLLLLCSSFGPRRAERLDRLCMLSAMVELTHMASLIHDDIVDDAGFRRGKPSLQSRFGKDAAVYAGDFLIARVNYWEGKEQLGETAALLAETVERMCLGEIGQARCRYREDVTEESYFENIRGKTAALFRTACRLGASEAGCPEDQAERLGELGEKIGLMFQLRDDLLDFALTKKERGKETGKDFLDGIYTLPVILAARQEAAGEALRRLMRQNREGSLTEEGLRQVKELVLSHGAEPVRQRIHQYSGACLQLLDTLEEGPDGARIRELIGKLDAV